MDQGNGEPMWWEALRTRGVLMLGLAAAALLVWRAGADVAGGDSGEIGGAAFTLGVAHPTGFPLDMLVLRMFALVPLGTLAFRENLGVACLAAAAVGCSAGLSAELARLAGMSTRGRATAALFASCALLAFPGFIAAALGVEVYASALLIVLLGLSWALRARGISVLAPLSGLALCSHVTTALLLLPSLLVSLHSRLPGPVRARAIVRAGAVRAPSVLGGALALAYLPLAARRRGAFDWGDPQTLSALLRHLSAARIREAYAGEMFNAHASGAQLLLAQIFEPVWLAPLALLGVWVLARRARSAALLVGAVWTLDLAYAVWVNPMGIAEHQVGHVAGALSFVFAGLGAAFAIERAAQRARGLRWAASSLAAASGLWLIVRAPWPIAEDGYAVLERYAAGSPLESLPPRAIYLCSSDSACAAGLFARYAEGARPDLFVAPRQHLWDRTVLRRLPRAGAVVALLPEGPPARGQRAALAERVTQAIVRRCQLRAVYVEYTANSPAPRFGLEHAPWIALNDARPTPALDASAQLRGLQRARFGESGPQSPLARTLWASAEAETGKALLLSAQPQAARARFERALALTPESASAHTNLAVTLEQLGDFVGALQQTRVALSLDPLRPTPWVNLVRLLLRTDGPDGARLALQAAQRNDVHDPRLTELAAALQSSQGKTSK